MKRCRHCHVEKPLVAFSRNKRSRDGHHWWCKACNAAAARTRYAKDPARAREKSRLAMRARRAADPERVRSYIKKWRAENVGRVRARDARRRETAERRAYHAAYCRRWRAENRGRARAIARKGAQVRRARKLAKFVEDVDPFLVYERDGGICGICGNPVERDAFHVDHVVPLARGGAHSYANTQVAHPICNRRKGGLSRAVAA